MSDYFVLQVDHFVEPAPGLTRVRSSGPDFSASRWVQGSALDPPSATVELEIYRGRGGLSEIYLTTIPLFRNDVIEVMRGAGVDNLQCFPARLHDPEHGQTSDDYQAVNIVGAVKAADLDKSEYTPSDAPALRTEFRKLVIDAGKAGGQPLFRLLESIDTIVVHRSVKEALPRERFRYLRFLRA